MKAKIVKIGNSQGLRIPKPLLEQTGLNGEVEITVKDDTLIIACAGNSRLGWAKAFQAMADCRDDELLDDALTTSTWDEDGWKWQ